MAVTLADCQRMVEATRKAKVQLIVGHSHSFNRPILRTREIVKSGAVGGLKMITALNFTDYMYRPRRPEELQTESGGRVRSVRAATGSWDLKRPTEGAYSALLPFENGAFASVVYSGYGHFDSDEFTGWIGEMGQKKSAESHGAARKALQAVASTDDETALKNARNYGGKGYAPAPRGAADPRLHQHFGFLVASCERADLRPLPTGVMIYGDADQRLDPLPAPAVPRAEVIDELYAAVVFGKAPLHNGEWALATTEVCLAMLKSAGDKKEITLHHQVGDEPMTRA